MKGREVATAATLRRTPWALVKGISDFGDSSKARSEHRRRQAVAAAVDLILQCLTIRRRECRIAFAESICSRSAIEAIFIVRR